MDIHPTVPPTKAIPITISLPQPTQIFKQLPFASLPPNLPPTPHLTPQYLLHLLTILQELWKKPLWNNIQPQQDILKLTHNLTMGVLILLLIDATMNAAKQSCVAWTIYSTMNLWKGSMPSLGLTKTCILPDPKLLGL